jgi:hypothetical protein
MIEGFYKENYMPVIKYENRTIFEKYQNLLLNESKKGMRRKAQIIEDKIDDFVDENKCIRCLQI